MNCSIISPASWMHQRSYGSVKLSAPKSLDNR
jgi:hypothetical protein